MMGLLARKKTHKVLSMHPPLCSAYISIQQYPTAHCAEASCFEAEL